MKLKKNMKLSLLHVVRVYAAYSDRNKPPLMRQMKSDGVNPNRENSSKIHKG